MEQDNTRLSQLFDEGRNASPKVSFEEAKTQFLNSIEVLNSTSPQGITRFLTFKNILIMTLLSIILIVTAVFFNNTQEPKVAPKIGNNSTLESVKRKIETISTQEDQTILIMDKKQQERVSPEKSTELVLSPDSNNFNDGLYETNNKLNGLLRASESEIRESSSQLTLDSVSRFPVLTPEEIKENNKRKEAYSGISKKHLIPYGYLLLSKDEMLTNKYYKNATPYFLMKQTEVSNLQYKTFLFDLLVQNRKDDFLIAKPDQKKWREINSEYAEYMEANYFSNEIYDDHPVVNVSREGAEMFCEWLTNEINKTQTKRLKGKKVMVALPSANQWIHGALAGKNNMYGWGETDNRQNEHGCFLANFKYSSETDSIPITNCEIKDHDAYTTAGLILGKGNFTAKIYSYNPNAYGLFCMSGNVAEMVTYPDGIGAKGGSWNSFGESIKIKAADEYKGVTSPNVNIGFRPIITFSE